LDDNVNWEVSSGNLRRVARGFIGARHEIAAIGVSLTFFFGILLLKLNPSLTKPFSMYSAGLFLIILLVYFLSFNLPGKLRWVAVISVTAAIFAFTLSYKWGSAYSDATIIGGLLPYKDGAMYYHGANFILLGDRIPGADWPAAWRPIFPSFLASILFLVSNNLQWALAIIVVSTAISISLTSFPIYKSQGTIAASVYITLLYLFIQPMIGNPLTELHGLAMGCMAFILLWFAANGSGLHVFLWGIIVLMAGVSSRAGAFLIFPMLIIWAGYRYRSRKRFSYKATGLTFLTVFASYLIINPIYTNVIVGEGPGKATFGNFAYSLYGQVSGGIGWASAMSLGTKTQGEIYRIILSHFLNQPTDFLHAIVRSFGDFFLPGSRGIFSFISTTGTSFLDTGFWFLGLVAVITGTVMLIKARRSYEASLWILVFIGILLSIPFLPPIDGGRRFYASTMPFFFAVAGYGLHWLKTDARCRETQDVNMFRKATHFMAFAILALTFVLPGAILFSRRDYRPRFNTPGCTEDAAPFALFVNEGAFIDIVNNDAAICGYVPEVCRTSFVLHGGHGGNDDFYNALVKLSAEYPVMRLLPAINLVEGGIHFYIGRPDQLQSSRSLSVVAGCADVIYTKYQSIYRVQSSGIDN
jgi:hypothetical protein